MVSGGGMLRVRLLVRRRGRVPLAPPVHIPARVNRVSALAEPVAHGDAKKIWRLGFELSMSAVSITPQLFFVQSAIFLPDGRNACRRVSRLCKLPSLDVIFELPVAQGNQRLPRRA
jgi:hypothetical protein